MQMVIGRLTNFSVDAAQGVVFAGDDRGLIYRISADLSNVARSAGTSHGVAIHAITHDDRYVYTRDVAGNVVQWDRERLFPLHFALSQHCTEAPEDTPAPSPSHLLACVGDELLACNSHGTVSRFDRATMAFVGELDAAPGAFPERMREHGGDLYVTDVDGNVHRGRIGRAFEKIASVPGGVIHAVVPDPCFPRLWCTSDITGGVFFVAAGDGRLLGELRLTNDDVEEIAFDATGERAYVGCFDHHVHVVENGEQPREIGCIGPFKFQINHIGLLDDTRLLVLLESGELHLVDATSGSVVAQVGGTNAIWSIALAGDRLACAAEHGNVERFRIASRGTALAFVRESPAPSLDAGRIRALKALAGGWVCGTTAGSVIALDAEGSIRWKVQTGGIVRDVDVDAEAGEIVACNEVGEIVLLDVNDGAVKRRYKNAKPVWCAAFDDDGHVVFGERTLMPATGPREASHLVFIDRQEWVETTRLMRHGNHKRIRRLDGQRVLVNGNGTIGVQIVDSRRCEVEQSYSDWIINTPENAVVHGERVYVVTYGYQLITYDRATSQALDVQFVVEGYPTALEVYANEQGRSFLIVAGRNFLMAFLIGDDGTPQLVCTRYLYDIAPAEPAAAGHGAPLAKVRWKAPSRVLERTASEALEAAA